MLTNSMKDTRRANRDPLVISLFRLWSPIYDSPIFQWVYYGRIHDRFLEAARELAPARILDVGCGTGELLVKCARRWPRAELVGVDLSRAMLARAKAKSWGRRRPLLKEANVYDLPFAGGAFDLVFNSISSHFYRDGARAFGELGRVTAPAGHLYQASLGNGLLRFVPGPWKEHLSIPSAVYRSPDEQSTLLAQAGFAVQRVRRHFGNTWLYECRRN